MDCSLLGSSIHGIFQARLLEWGAIAFSKYWVYRFKISPSNEYSWLISFRMNWFDLLAVQGTLKSLLQHHSSNVSLLHHSAFFMVQLSHPYMTTWKTIALTIWTFVSKMVSLHFNVSLFRFVIAFLSRKDDVLSKMYSAYKLNKQGDNIQARHFTFPSAMCEWSRSCVLAIIFPHHYIFSFLN